jgi:hypothetical protein
MIICLITLGSIATSSVPAPDDSHIWLYSTQSKHITLEQSQNQIQHLTDLALQVQIFRIGLKSTQENILYQVRGFYVLILTGLLPALFLTSNKKTAIQVAGIFITLFMYGLDVYLKDISQRPDKYIRCDAKTVRTLSKIQPDSTHWYYIDFDRDTVAGVVNSTKPIRSLVDEDKEEGMLGNRLCRKIGEALTPKFDQICFYMVPIIIFIWGDWKRGRKAS